MLRLAAAATCALAIVSVLSASQASDASLTQDEIRLAIEHGRSSEPSPYILRSPFPNQGEAAALVYTPFVRIAIAARQALSKGQTFEAINVDPGDASPLIHVLVSADAVAPIGILTASDPVQVEVIDRPVQRLLGSSQSRKAKWVRHEVSAVVGSLPGSGHKGVIVAAFNRVQLCTDCYVVAYRMRSTPEGHKEIRATWAVIKKADVERWR